MVGDDGNALGRQVQFVGELAIDRERVDRHQPAGEFNRLDRRCCGKEICQAQRVVDRLQDHAGIVDEIDFLRLLAPDFPASQIAFGFAAFLLFLIGRLDADHRGIESGVLVFARQAEAERHPWAFAPALRRSMAEVAPAYGLELDAFIGEAFIGLGSAFQSLLRHHRFGSRLIGPVPRNVSDVGLRPYIASSLSATFSRQLICGVLYEVALEPKPDHATAGQKSILRLPFQLDLKLAVVDLHLDGSFDDLADILGCGIFIGEPASDIRRRRAVDHRRNDGLDVGKQDVEIVGIAQRGRRIAVSARRLACVGLHRLFGVVHPMFFELGRRIDTSKPFGALVAKALALFLIAGCPIVRLCHGRMMAGPGAKTLAA
ncbi:hypothetical protein NKH54_22775 [Mesorhizobium sp. M1004]|uniref:hypothetical protein n=1 Tax=Mesorhizobium sp. M1004 TaxID=2957046 RepID=UPI00333A4E7B